MEKKTNYSILGYLYSNQFYLYMYVGSLVICCCSYEIHADSNDSFTLSSFTYGRTVLRPYDWRYIRVDLPTWFSSVTISLESDVDLDKSKITMADKSDLPMICAREGSPPLPDTYNTSFIGLVLDPVSNGSLALEGLQFSEKCYPMQKNVLIKLTNEQISPGVWYFGLFNGIGSARTQSKMINRGSGYSFSGNVSVEGCLSPSISGQFCNETIDHLSCVDQKSMQGTITSCRNDGEQTCIHQNGSKLYSLDLLGVTEEIIISSTNVIFNQTQLLKGANNDTNITLMCYARHGSIASPLTHDYSGNINNAPLVIRSPKIGRWYVTVTSLNLSNEITGSMNVCYSLEWKLLRCPIDKAGLNCTWERYTLQTIMRKNPSVPFESYYLPASDKFSSNSANFPLEPLLSNLSLGQSQSQNFGWTYFVVDIPSGASGGSIHIRLNSDKKINHEIYTSYGGLPFEDKWDYFYANLTSNSNGSMFFKLYDSDEKSISFYIVYVRGGTWGIGVKHSASNSNAAESQSQTTMSISVERCPRRCSSHGTCQNIVEMSGLSLYSYCWCDRTHGGFDCSIEVVSHQGHIWQSISLIASNAAFVFPAYWALRQKAFAEWVIYTCSGISSGLYHACDVGTWCALSFRVLQFMDFWLSFMAVVSTFVYLADIDEGSKRTIHTVVAILTALMAENGPTRSSNIILVIAIGAAGLLVGFSIEFFRDYRRFSFSLELMLNMLHRWQTIKDWCHNLIKTLLKRFRWFFVVSGFAALAMAAISWNLESTESYWFWHSMWHVSIYISSFLFIVSKVNVAANGEPRNVDYELTRQDSLSRGQHQPENGGVR
ncbi:hypothetical protein SSX86_006856 [Deinandra increscens subsp. villosa]|uniref:EGF-like domain-containing protein n=1 Tax=Deinandra increscens subsp. villosa TaxID=3103831 RepID=A0AAP0DNE5_9ASTR